MKRWFLFLVVVIVIGLVWWTSRGSKGAPDQRLAAHTRALCKIAESGAEHPDDGVRRMFRFYGDRGPAMAKDWAALLVLIERIDDDEAHDARARLAARRMRAPMVACAQTFERFANAVVEDPEASARLERGVERFGRTIEILLGSDGELLRAPFDLGRLETQIDRALAPRASRR